MSVLVGLDSIFRSFLRISRWNKLMKIYHITTLHITYCLITLISG